VLYLRKRLHLFIGILVPMAYALSSVARPLLSTAVGIPKGVLAVLPLTSNVAQILMRPIFGVLCDRYGRKIFMTIGASLYLLSYLYQSFAQSALDMILASFIFGKRSIHVFGPLSRLIQLMPQKILRKAQENY